MFTINNSPVASQSLQDAFATIANAGTDTPPTTEQLVALLTEFSTDPAGIGYKKNNAYQSPIVMAELFNLGGYIPNPVAQGTVTLSSIPRNSVHDFLGALIVEVIAAGTQYATSLAILQSIQNTVVTTTTDPILVANIQEYIPAIKAGGFDPTAFITAIITAPDPSWTPTIFVQPRTDTVFPGQTIFVTPTDVTTALGS